MSWTRINGTGTYSTSEVANLSLSTTWSVTAGNLFRVAVNSWLDTAEVTYIISDGHNTYASTPISQNGVNGAYTATQIFWDVVTTGGTLTVVITPSFAAYVTFDVEEWSFTPGATITAESHNASSGTSGATATSGNLTFTAGDLLIAITDNDDAVTVTAGGPFTPGYNTSAGGGAGEAAATEYYANATGSPLAATFGFSASNQWNCSAVAFKATVAATAAPAVVRPLSLEHPLVSVETAQPRSSLMRLAPPIPMRTYLSSPETVLPQFEE